jgi:hypothetical protein
MCECRFLRFLAVCALLISGLAMAQQSQLPPPVDRTQSAEARKKAQAAQLEVIKAQGALTQVVTKMRTDFEAGSDWQTAQTALKTAQAEYDAARKPIVDAMKKRADYQKAETEKAKAEQELAELRANGTIGEPVLKAINRRADALADMTKIETDLMNAEPKVGEARKKLADATAEVAQLKKQFDTSIQGDTGWQEAKKAVDTAQEQVTLANKELTDAAKREAEAEKQRQEQIRQSRKR